jgi:hypothetical protein
MSERINAKRKFNNLYDINKKNRSIKCQPVVWEVEQLAKYGKDGTLVNGKFNRGKHSTSLIAKARVEEIDDDHDCDDDDDDYAEDYGSTVWSPDKMSKFIYKIFIGTAPLTFLVFVDDDDKYYIYDGTNRATAITKFYDNTLKIKHDGECYFFKDLPSRREQNMFLKAKLEIREYSGCTEAYMCSVAADMNNGTPMTMGELLNLMRKASTPRCAMFDAILEDFEFTSVDFGYRSSGIKMTADLFKHIELQRSSWADKEGMEKMKSFLTSEDAVTNEIMMRSIFGDLKKIVQYYKDTDADKIMFSKQHIPRTKAIFQTLAMLAYNHQVTIYDPSLFANIKKVIDDNKVKYASTNGLYKYMLSELNIAGS